MSTGRLKSRPGLTLGPRLGGSVTDHERNYAFRAARLRTARDRCEPFTVAVAIDPASLLFLAALPGGQGQAVEHRKSHRIFHKSGYPGASHKRLFCQWP